MKKIICFFLITLHFANCSAEVSLLGGKGSEQVTVHNRILAKVNGKPISVVDLMKKMDILFYREFPQYTSFPEARYQFYLANWESILKELIDKELIIADAEENKLPVNSGDVRQEMEQLFGPNIINNLDKIGMTFDEAWKIVQGDIMLQRMLYIRVNAKAMRNVTPRDVFAAYEQYAKDNILSEQWQYQVISIRDKDPSAGAATANIAFSLLAEDQVSLEDLPSKIKALPLASSSQINISESFLHGEKEISADYKAILQKMAPGEYSKPVSQKSKDKSTVFRLFHLDKKIPGGAPPFKQVENKLKNQLIEKEIVEHSTAYFKKLRNHFDVQETIPAGFAPFSLK